MYSTFIKPDNDYRPGRRSGIWQQPNIALQQYLRTLIERPDLAQKVKRLIIGSWTQPLTLAEAESDPPYWLTAWATHRPRISIAQDASSFDIFQAVLEKICRSNDGGRAARFSHRLLSESEDAEVGLLLLLTPNIEELYSRQYVDHMDCFWPIHDYDLENSFKCTKPLSRLKEVTLRLSRATVYYSYYLGWIERMPTLETFEMEESNFLIPHVAWVPVSPHLRHVSIQGCNLSRLRNLSGLETLKC